MSAEAGLPKRSHRAAYVISLAQWSSIFIVYLASLAVNSRLLDKEEIGGFGVAAAIYIVSNILGSFGVDRYLVQVRELSPADVTAALALSLAASVLCTATLLIAAGPVASFYGDPRLGPVLRIVALAMLVTPVHTIWLGLLQRDLLFGRLYAANTGSALLGAVLGVLLAWSGWGAAALAWGLAAEAIAKAVIAAACTKVPAFSQPGRTTWRNASFFGGSALGANLLTSISETLPALISGRLLSIEAVGLLNRAQRMVQILQDAVQTSAKTVALPALAAGQRTSADLAMPYRLKISYLTGFAWPVFLVIAVTAGPIVHIMLGPQWTAAIPVLRILALGGLTLPFVAMNISFFTVMERLDIMMRIQSGLLPVRLVLLGAACWQGNLETLAVAQVTAQALRAVLVSRALARLLHLPRRTVWINSAPSVVPAVAAAAVATMVMVGMTSLPFPASDFLRDLATLAITGTAATLAWLVAIYFGQHPLRREVRVLRDWLGARIANTRRRRVA